MGHAHGGIDKVASSWTLPGWSPPWTRATVTLRGVKSPSTWMCTIAPPIGTTPKISVSTLRLLLQTPPFTFMCNVLYSAAILLDLHV